MPFAALTYDIKAGYEKELAEIFGSFRRVGSADVAAERDMPTTRILSTAVFLRDSTMVRVDGMSRSAATSAEPTRRKLPKISASSFS
jgi:hypothetical protein